MGYGVLKVNFNTLRGALALPKDCTITAATNITSDGLSFLLSSPVLPDVVEGEDYPNVEARVFIEHIPGQDPSFRKLSTRIEVK